MKLKEDQIRKIYLYLQKDLIFYDDIRHEMTDHIAATLEEDTELKVENFEVLLKSYMNSHHKVRLLTAAREEEKIRDSRYRQYFLKQFITGRGVLLLSFIFSVVYASRVNVWASGIIDVLLGVILWMSAIYTRPLKKKWPFMLRLINSMAYITAYWYWRAHNCTDLKI